MKHPYTKKQMEKFSYYCNIMPHDIRQDLEFYQPCRDCLNVNVNLQYFDHCGIDRFLQVGSGYIHVIMKRRYPDPQLAKILDAPFQNQPGGFDLFNEGDWLMRVQVGDIESPDPFYVHFHEVDSFWYDFSQ